MNSKQFTPAHDRPPITHREVEVPSVLERVVVELAHEVRKLREEPQDHLWDISDVAAFLKVSKRTVETRIAKGEIIPIRVGRSRRFSREAIDAYLRNQIQTIRRSRKR